MPEIENNGVRIFFEEVGSGPPVVLGHSFLCSGEMWRHQIEPLAERHRVINIDHRGHGRSGNLTVPFDLYDMVGDVVAVLDHLEVERAVWAGLSIGGMVAMRAAITVAERVAGLILVDTDAGAETGYKKLKYRAMKVGAKMMGLRPFLPAIIPLMFGSTTRSRKPELVKEWGERFLSTDETSLFLTLDALLRRDMVIDKLSEVRVSALVIVGSEDISLPVEYAQKIASAIPGASLVVVPESGHLSSLEQPEAVTRAMVEFLEGVMG
jgi:pimeloyl-ACP methyl ester carboxylesterase